MTRVIAIAKYTDQVAPYDYERKTVTRTFSVNEPISNILDWVNNKKAETDSLIIRPDESEVQNG